MEYILLYKRHLSFATTHSQKNSNIKPVSTIKKSWISYSWVKTQTNLNLESSPAYEVLPDE